MGLLSALYKSYKYAEDNDLVSVPDDSGEMILPLYHDSKKSDGKNIIEVLISKDSHFIHADILENGQKIIFPVTEDSVARSSGVAPHPLVDNFAYLIQDGSAKSKAYMKQMEAWLSYKEEPFVRVVHDFLVQEDFFKKIQDLFIEKDLDRVYQGRGVVQYTNDKGKKETFDFSKCFLTFRIENFEGQKDLGVSDNPALHKAYIDYVRYLFSQDDTKQKILCNISHQEDYLCTKHRPLIGTARLISQITANDENYRGRFSLAEQTIKIGAETSQKVHLMAKYLLAGKNTCRWLGEQTYMVSWFSDDICNRSALDVTQGIENSAKRSDILSILNSKSGPKALKIADEISESIVKSFVRGEQLFADHAKYYIAIFDKTSNGRVAAKYFNEIDVSVLKDRLVLWQGKYAWEGYDKNHQKTFYTPSPIRIIKAAYGIQEKNSLEIHKGEFLRDQYQGILSALVEGRSLPENFYKALEMNIKNRHRYPDKRIWNQVKFCALAILSYKEGVVSNMLDRQNTDRSYLYGRLLALYERMEAACYEKDEGRVTNAEKMWTSFINTPVTMNLRLRTLLRPYQIKLKVNEEKRGIYYKLMKDIREVTLLLEENYDYRCADSNAPLGAGFIFGYEAQMKDIFTKKDTQESEENHD
ncbi:type I-C CRISPR-associated protein Cas8c/Csd1 [Peptococcus simiae]|uniref:type I-C CRISPR-associated protein Cas8c/Csd1 n=1 Tax=Peptococcus simiae TaxID=1643805 RepID=UPI0039812E5C